MHPLYYPRLIKRVRALLIDSILLPVAALATLLIGASTGISSTGGKLLLIVLPVFILEPVMLATTGGTIGHHLNGVKVTKKNGLDRINIFAAVIRFGVKLFFGWFSLIAVLITKKHQAVHDLVTGSIVTHRDVSRLPQYEVLQERETGDDDFVYPSAMRRIAVIFFYCFLIFVLYLFAIAIGFTDDCITENRCTAVDKSIMKIGNVALLLGLGSAIVFGWRGRLYGCRRTPVYPA